MKRLLLVMMAVCFAASSLFSQTKTKTKTNMGKDMTHCYAMKDGKLMHCMGKTGDEQTTTVTLKNGTTVSPTGEVTMKDGTTKTLADGECISPQGKIMSFDKMHPAAGKHKTKTKQS
jgi:hypothetical protein